MSTSAHCLVGTRCLVSAALLPACCMRFPACTCVWGGCCSHLTRIALLPVSHSSCIHAGTSLGAAFDQIRQVDQTSGQSTEPESEGSGQQGSREQANADQSGVGNNRSNPNGNGLSDKQSERLGSGNSFKRQLSREEQHEQDRQQMPPPQCRGEALSLELSSGAGAEGSQAGAPVRGSI